MCEPDNTECRRWPRQEWRRRKRARPGAGSMECVLPGNSDGCCQSEGPPFPPTTPSPASTPNALPARATNPVITIGSIHPSPPQYRYRRMIALTAIFAPIPKSATKDSMIARSILARRFQSDRRTCSCVTPWLLPITSNSAAIQRSRTCSYPAILSNCPERGPLCASAKRIARSSAISASSLKCLRPDAWLRFRAAGAVSFGHSQLDPYRL
jgi:hypothetical protein